jgi:hypothetical protein
VSGERNFLSIPFVLGFGVPISPAKAITLTPWFEFSPGVNLDTVIHPWKLEDIDPNDYVVNGEIHLTQDDVEKVVADSVELDVSASVGARAGLDLTLHVSDAFDFTVNTALSSVGTAFSGTRVIYVGGGFVWRWDDIVPAVLPAGKRLLHESCDDIETRFRSCPNSRRWRSPEESNAPAPRAPVLEPVPGAGTSISPAPAPAPPAARVAPALPPAPSALPPAPSALPPAPSASPAAPPLAPVPATPEPPPSTGAFPPAP